MPDKVKEIQLRSTFSGGHECVNRLPPVINEHIGNVDTVRITNKNPSGTGSSITVTLDAATRGNVFNSPPVGPQVLHPGDSLELHVKPGITSAQAEGFKTDPPNCAHHDSGDIVIQP